jgi:uncharacterized membrane protein
MTHHEPRILPGGIKVGAMSDVEQPDIPTEPDEPGDDLAFDTPMIESMGPIQMTSLAFPGNRFKGEILPELEKLKKAGIVRIVDLLLVRKDELGNVMVTTATDLDWEEAISFGSYVGALAGYVAHGPAGIEKGAMAGAAELADGHLFDEDDVFRVTQSLPKNMSAVLVLLEHLWAKPLFDAVDRAAGVELSNDWIRPEEIVSVVHKAVAPPEPPA